MVVSKPPPARIPWPRRRLSPRHPLLLSGDGSQPSGSTGSPPNVSRALVHLHLLNLDDNGTCRRQLHRHRPWLPLSQLLQERGWQRVPSLPLLPRATKSVRASSPMAVSCRAKRSTVPRHRSKVFVREAWTLQIAHSTSRHSPLSGREVGGRPGEPALEYEGITSRARFATKHASLAFRVLQ